MSYRAIFFDYVDFPKFLDEFNKYLNENPHIIPISISQFNDPETEESDAFSYVLLLYKEA